MVFPVFSFAQMMPQIPTQIKPPILGKAYWCAEVEDIMFSPQKGQRLTVGVRVKLTKKTVIRGAPGQKLCNCAFEGPSDAPVKFWSKTMSLRLIGVKYSETETNLLEYHGPTPSFPPYNYSGFQVIGFTVTETDLKRGYIDVWGWASKEPLQCRDAFLHATLDVNGYALKKDNDPDYLKKGCFPSGDFVKRFKPNCLEVPGIRQEAIKESVKSFGIPTKPESPGEKKTLPTLPSIVHRQKDVLQIQSHMFEFVEKLPKIPTKLFTRHNFEGFIKTDESGKEFVILKEKKKTIRLPEGPPIVLQVPQRTIELKKFLEEVNAIEKWLNESGYSLRDKKPIKIRYIYPREQFKLQRDLLNRFAPPPPQVTCEGYSSDYDDSSGPVKEPVPFEKNMRWYESFGDKNFGATLDARVALSGETTSSGTQERLDINPYFLSKISLFGVGVNILKIEKGKDHLIASALNGKMQETLPLNGEINGTLFEKGIKWETEIQFPIGPINIKGEFGFTGQVRADYMGKMNAGSAEINGEVGGMAKADAFGEIGASYEIVTVGIGGKLTLLHIEPSINGGLALTQINNKEPCFNATIGGNIYANLLSGSLYVFGEIDYIIDEKQIEVEFYNFRGFEFNYSPLFKVDLTGKRCIPATKDRGSLYLVIDKIYGITPYTARNEKIEGLEPLDFELIVDIGGKTYTKILKDNNKSGKFGDALGEYDEPVFEIPLSSYKKIPISIEVKQRYKIGTLEFTSPLDLAKGEWKKVELCYDPGKKTFTGTVSGGEKEEIKSVGDTNYWGERSHGINCHITDSRFRPAPTKAK
jgi:hypothetical protein